MDPKVRQKEERLDMRKLNLEKCESDLKTRLGVDSYDIYVWPQTWPNTSCGFGGISGQALTRAYTTVFICLNLAIVYHDNRFAYMVEDPTDLFWAAMKNFNLVGASFKELQIYGTVSRDMPKVP